MTILDHKGISFFQKELLEETNRQLAFFETDPPAEVAAREMGRLRLYEERAKIRRHFFICEENLGAYDTNHPQHGLLGKLEGNPGSACLIWLEFEGLRHSIKTSVENDLTWMENRPPEARLTSKGIFKKKMRLNSDENN